MFYWTLNNHLYGMNKNKKIMYDIIQRNNFNLNTIKKIHKRIKGKIRQNLYNNNLSDNFAKIPHDNSNSIKVD